MAAYFWVGGSGTWDASDTTHWATTTGGAGGAGVPTNADTVTFDTNSGTAATVTVASTAVSLSTTVNKSDITLSLSGSPTLCTSAGTLTLTAGTISLGSNTLTIGLFSSSNSNARTINFGTGSIVINSTTIPSTVWNVGTTTNLTISGTPNVTFSCSGAGNFSINQGVLAESSSINFTFNGSSSANFRIGSLDGCKNFTVNNTAQTIQVQTNATITIYGNLLISGSTQAVFSSGASSTITFAATSAKTITTNGGISAAASLGIVFNGIGGSWTLQDDLDLSAGNNTTITLTNGTFDANNKNVLVGSFASSNSNTRTLNMGSGTWTLYRTNAGVVLWDTSTTTNLTFNKGTSTILLTGGGTSARSFAGGGLTFYNLTIGGTTGIFVLTFTGSNTFNAFSATKTSAYTLTFTAGTTTTVSSWGVYGSSGNIVTINSSSAGSAATLSFAGTGVVSSRYLSIQDSTATPSLVWYAGTTSTDVSGNSGWLFTSPSTGQFFMFF